jgi:serine/threonine protein kinase
MGQETSSFFFDINRTLPFNASLCKDKNNLNLLTFKKLSQDVYGSTYMSNTYGTVNINDGNTVVLSSDTILMTKIIPIGLRVFFRNNHLETILAKSFHTKFNKSTTEMVQREVQINQFLSESQIEMSPKDKITFNFVDAWVCQTNGYHLDKKLQHYPVGPLVVNEHGGIAYIVTDFIPNTWTLEDICNDPEKNKLMDVQVVLKLKSKIDEMHKLGIYHGDLNTKNILVTYTEKDENGDQELKNPFIINFGKAENWISEQKIKMDYMELYIFMAYIRKNRFGQMNVLLENDKPFPKAHQGFDRKLLENIFGGSSDLFDAQNVVPILANFRQIAREKKDKIVESAGIGALGAILTAEAIEHKNKR